MVGEALQKRDERGPIVGVDPGKQFDVLLVGDTFGLGHQLVGGRGEMDGVGAPIGGVAAALDESATFEFIDQPDHHVAVDAQGVGKLLL